MKQRMIDVLRCSRSILFENESPDFAYSMRGTGFACRLGETDLFVTARHVIDGFPLESLCIPFHYGSREFLPYSLRMSILRRDPDDTDWTDIAILALNKDQYKDQAFNGDLPFMLKQDSLDTTLSQGTNLVLRGFPSSSNNIDYDNDVISLAGTSFGAKIAGPSSMKHCTKIIFNDLSKCKTLDGTSGAPVFSFDKPDPPYQMKLAGMMLRGTKESGLGHMLNADSIHQMIQRAITGQPPGDTRGDTTPLRSFKK